jgi:16S rRNA (adenine1518-N6/adenine1519-N6)-dimethyltransferase
MNLPRERRQFGQNFLVDEAVCQSIVRDIDPRPEGTTIEIGPGEAAITRLLGRSGRIVAIEIDPKWATKLSEKWGKALPLTVVNKDALLVELDPLLSEGPSGIMPVLCGNLPYNRATPIILRFVPRIREFRHMLFMVQYEVAKRLCAAPGRRDYGSLSVQVQNHALCELRDVIGPEAFRPRPKVHSATVRMVARPAPLCADPRFPRFVREAFLHKRKTLVNALSYLFPQDVARAGLARAGVPEDVRAEQVALEDWVALFDAYASELPALPDIPEEPFSE